MSLINVVFRSRGVFRTIAAAMVAISQLPIPALDPYRQMLVELAAIIGGLGVAKAGAAKAGVM